MSDIFNLVLDRIHNHILPKTRNLQVMNEYTFEDELTPFEYGMKIESFFMFHIYLLNFNLVIHRFDTRTKCINNELAKITATINGLPLAERRKVEFDPDMGFPVDYNGLLRKKEIVKNWIIPLMSAIREMRMYNGKVQMSTDFDKMLIEHYDSIDYDKKLLFHFLVAKYKFRCKRRCLLKPKFIATFPDAIIDDTIIDIKTNIGFTELKDQCAQLLNQVIDFYAFRNFNNVIFNKTRISDFERKKILLPVRKLCLYYYRYDKFFTVDLKKVIGENEFNQLIAIKKDYSKIIF